MRVRCFAVLCLALFVVAGCGTSTRVAEREYYEGEKLTRPDRIIVHDFVANPAEVPPESAFSSYTADSKTLTPDQLEVSRKLGAEIAMLLVEKLNAAGLPAVRAASQPAPLVNDIVIKGYFISLYQGSATRRVVFGLGSGNAELTTAVEVYQMTAQGLRRLGGGKGRTSGRGVPGVGVPAAVMAATGNPIGLIVGGSVNAAGEGIGSGSMRAAVNSNVDEIAAQLTKGAERQGWI